MIPSIRQNVLHMEPYSPGKPIDEVKRELGLDRVVKLASNENPLGASPKAVEAVRAAADQMHIYPDGAAYTLRMAVADKFGIAPDQVLLGNGSDELIGLLGAIFLEDERDEVVVGDPSFVRYDAAAQLATATLIKVPLDSELRHDLPAMVKAVTPRTKLLFIANPNNPTGTVVRKRELDAMLRDLPEHVTVVLDEAYFEFAAHLADFPSSLDYVLEGKNVVGLRTMSKAYGLAGIRVGYGFASSAIVDAANRARAPFNVNSLAQVAGVAGLADEDHMRRTVENNARGVKMLSEAFERMGAKPFESFANFVFADLGRPAQPVFKALLEKGVIVRGGDVFGMPTCLRVSVGAEEEMSTFVEAFESVMLSGANR